METLISFDLSCRKSSFEGLFLFFLKEIHQIGLYTKRVVMLAKFEVASAETSGSR